MKNIKRKVTINKICFRYKLLNLKNKFYNKLLKKYRYDFLYNFISNNDRKIDHIEKTIDLLYNINIIKNPFYNRDLDKTMFICNKKIKNYKCVKYDNIITYIVMLYNDNKIDIRYIYYSPYIRCFYNEKLDNEIFALSSKYSLHFDRYKNMIIHYDKFTFNDLNDCEYIFKQLNDIPKSIKSFHYYFKNYIKKVNNDIKLEKYSHLNINDIKKIYNYIFNN